MSTARLGLPAGIAQWRTQARQAWRARAPRERLALTVMAVVLIGFVAWLLLVQPAWRTLRDAPAQLDQLDVELQRMQRLAAESETLRGVAAVPAGQAALALRAATDRLGSAARLMQQGDRATLTLNGLAPEALRAWLLEVRSAARVRPVEAQLTRSGAGYSGTLVVQIGQGSGTR